MLGLAFTLSTQRRNRDLDNLMDGLAPVFNRHCQRLTRIRLLRLRPRTENTETLQLIPLTELTDDADP